MNQTLVTTLMSTVHSELEELIQYIYMIVYPIIFITGLIGNLLSSLLFSITELNQTSCGIYFLLLAIADSLALIGGLHHCLTIGYRVIIHSVTYCRARNFISYTSMDLASWMVVAISLDRYIKVKFPVKSRDYCTQKLAIIVSCVLTFVLVLKNLHFTTKFIGNFAADASEHCGPNPKYPTYMSFFQNVWPWIDLAIFALLPFILITSCNIFIIYNLYKRRVQLGHRNLDRSVVKFLLISSISFIICNFPVSITIVLYPYISSNYGKKQSYDEIAFAFDILRLPSYISLAFNFYLYYYSSSLFRRQAMLLFHRLFRIRSRVDQNQTPAVQRICQEQNNSIELSDER
ncbi:unnamed protein product [Adineta ricciae]|uniref:G-protein coupled receptors family 1 profile domain-containing protein n=1 Tax=Adineta ricciae TaxID=249248 RepID=A0A814C684_ADIRI|nr:unnamed protein product [Adineta ricciae]CAF0935975.1 unnamed protein product [Adineta ricciae]